VDEDLAMSVRSAVDMLVIALGLVLLVVVVVVVFGAIFALAHRNRGLGFSYLASAMTTSKVKGEDNQDF
jgi:hypothetical protein